ncbi:MFS general substrate transporter [Aspergillus ibericus CBS 121593]|uniref:MFS general substrate transporter n=1 Tax=Aspergillus ibericus CBS 121593 TaxID=1448316 RepID=A0A395GV76_9EURO|nr:MFS general substrate transporter [Aspergillus ibericus CBS 121593]RAK99292.1 MFS general substrate transporter [Aspergillus ibericus CBS 121593]
MRRLDYTKSSSEHVESLGDGPVTAPKHGQLTTFHPVINPALEKRVIRKIDMMVIPFICITYLITYIDKAMLGYSAVFGLKESLHLHGTEYSWLGSMFYFGYLAFEYPTTFVMQKVPVSKWLSVNLFFWGGITIALAGCSNFRSFLALRFLIGALESCSTPAYLLITATWYTVEEQPIRIGWWSTFLGLANSFGGLLAFGVGQIKGALQSWQYQFIFIGAISCAWAIFMFFTLAEHPSTAPWLNTEEREAAVQRLGVRHQGANHREIKKYQIIEALTDPKTWLFFLCGVSTQVVNGAASNFGSLIIEGFGYSNLVTTLFQIPYGMVVLVSNVSAMYLQRWLPGQKRCLVAIIYVCPALAGAVGIHTISRDHKVALLVCYWLTSTYTASFAMVMSLITANTGGSTKRTVVNALFFVSYCVGNIVGPFSFKSNEAPTYTSGIVAMLVAYCVEIFLLLAFAAYAVMLNRKKMEVLHGQGLVLEDAGFRNEETPVDQTDKEDIFFCYSY